VIVAIQAGSATSRPVEQMIEAVLRPIGEAVMVLVGKLTTAKVLMFNSIAAINTK